MPTSLRSAVAWMRRRAENIVAVLLGVMFVAFILQVVFRYFFNFPIGWTSELSVITWLYMVLIGSAFWLKETEEVRFDLLSSNLGPRGRRVLGIAVAIVAVVLFGMALPASVSYIALIFSSMPAGQDFASSEARYTFCACARKALTSGA